MNRIEEMTRFMARMLLQHRVLVLVLMSSITLALGFSALHLKVDARFDKSIPKQHPYMINFLQNEEAFGGANTVLVALVNKQGDIFDPDFLQRLKKVTDDVFFIEGVRRESVRSLWTPRVRYIEITEQGFSGGSVIHSGFTGSAQDLSTVRVNTEKSGAIGRLVSNDLRGALVQLELQDHTPGSNSGLDYSRVARDLEALRTKYSDEKVDIHIVGFAKVVGDIGEGTQGVLLFFLAAGGLTTILLRWYTRSWALTWRSLIVAALPVLWLLGFMPLIGMGIDPLSILVPYLIFTIGVSHSVQMTSAWAASVREDMPPDQAAQDAFTALFMPGTLALLTNAIGFMVIMVVDIAIVRELGIMASIGVSFMILTNKILLPVVLSYGKVGHAPQHSRQRVNTTHKMSPGLGLAAKAATLRGTITVLLIATALTWVGIVEGSKVYIGDQGKGMPEFFPDSRYNQDSQAILKSFSLSSELLSVYVVPRADVKGEAQRQICLSPEVADHVDALEADLSEVEGVSRVIAYPRFASMINAGWNEGNPKWRVIADNQSVMGQASNQLITEGSGLVARNCEAMQVLIFATDHDTETIRRITDEVERFSETHPNAIADLKLGGGNLGVMAATNASVASAEPKMLAAIFVSLAVLCLLTFRDVMSVVVIIAPLALVSLLCNAVMAWLGIGLKVSTLPVVTLGVGVGVDYGIYLYERLKHHLSDGLSLSQSWALSLHDRGRAVLFTAATMSLGVGSWAFSSLKFQADMGLLLAFMFLVNVLGSLFLLPALAGLWRIFTGQRKSHRLVHR